MPEISVRVATADDLPSLSGFYSGDLGRVEPRRDSDFAQSVARAGAHLVSRSGSVVGCSMCYSLCDHRFVEVGSTLIRGLRGFPIYELLVSLQLLHEFVFRPPANMAVANVDVDQQGLIARVVKMGWRPYDPPDELLSANVETVALRTKAVTWFCCPASMLREHALRIDEARSTRELRSLRGEVETIDLSGLRLIREGARIVSCLAATDVTGSWSNEGWRDARASLERLET